MNSDINSTKDPHCCPPGASCACSFPSKYDAKPGIQRFKTVLFMIIVGAAITLGGLALMKRNKDSLTGAQAAPNTDQGESIAAQNNLLQDEAEFVRAIKANPFNLVIFPEPGGTTTPEIIALVDSAIKKIKDQQPNAAYYIFDSQAQDYEMIRKQFAIHQLPAVLVFKEGQKSMVFREPLTENRLLKAYLKSSSSETSCCSGDVSSSQDCGCQGNSPPQKPACNCGAASSCGQ